MIHVIPWNQRLGMIGEKVIESRLAYFSSPMRPPIDVGIDYHCHLENNTPPYFLVQAKGTQHFDEKWGRSLDRGTIEFWLSQQYPVYLIIYDEKEKKCYWLSIEQRRKELIDKLKTGQATVYVTVDKSNTLEEGKNENLHEQIKKDSASIRFIQNLIQGKPEFMGEGYVRTVPLIRLAKDIELNIYENIRMSIVYLAQHYYYLENDYQKAYFFCKFLADFDKSHYGHFVLLARICTSLGKKEEANNYYDEAIKICKRDTRWNSKKRPSDPTIEELISTINREKQNIEIK